MTEHNQLSILQYNVRKSKDTVMATLLRDAKTAEYDILAIQEPWKNPYMDTTHHPAKEIFHLCYPPEQDGKPARVCFFVNKRLDHTKWQFKAHTRDVSTLYIKQKDENEEDESQIIIHNVYNPPQTAEGRESALPTIEGICQANSEEEQIALGDYNLHHPLWGGARVNTHENEAEELIDIMQSQGMTNMLQQGTITYEEAGAETTIDLCWTSTGLIDRVIRCEVDRDMDHDSDHLPISIVIDLRVQYARRKPVRQWKHLEEGEFRKALKRTLPPIQRPGTKTALDQYTNVIIEAINSAVNKVLPKTCPSPRAREGWTAECKEVLAEVKRRKRHYNMDHTEESWRAYKEARNLKTKTVRKALQAAHRDRVEMAAATPESLWKVAKWARTRDSQPPSVTPAIKCPSTGREITETEEKARLFRSTFFPTPPEADLDDIQTAEYTQQVKLPEITEKEVMEAIRATAPLKTAGPDGISNKALQAGAELLTGHLTSIFKQSLKLGYCPKHFRTSTTVVLRKPGKDNYTVPKAYRPIALLNTVGKVMDAVIARRLSYLAETKGIIPHRHMGGRRLRSTDHALHSVIEKIYEAWNRGEVASLLLLDVSGAFDNISHKRLLHVLRKRRVDEQTVRWVASLLTDRYTRITMDGFESEEYRIQTGIPQGSPLSPILYVLYNSDLIDDCNTEVTTTGYIDDAAILACGPTTIGTTAKLERAMQKAQHWSATHASKFAPEKFQLVHFTRTRTKIDTEQPLHMPLGTIAPSKSCTYLGVTMDSKLEWREHIAKIEHKTAKTVNAIGALGSSTWGIDLASTRKIYQGVVIPQMMYASSLWSNSSRNDQPYTAKTLNKLEAIQARGARTISGAYRATSRPALDVETHLLPIKQQIWKHNLEALGRLQSSTGVPELANRPAQQHGSHKPKYSSPLQKIRTEAQSMTERSTEPPEPIAPFVMPPWQAGPTVHIDTSDEEARARHDAVLGTNAIRIYTDGSSIEGHVGASAVCPTAQTTRKAYMGTDKTSTVYAAELQGIKMALDIAQEQTGTATDRNDKRRIAIFVDNQAAIRTLTRPEGRSGAYIAKQIAQQIKQLQNNGHEVEVRWIPAHEGLEGNEAADLAAKEATGWREGDGARGDRADPPAELYALKAAMKMWTAKKAKRQWSNEWAQETRGRAAYRHNPTPSRRTLKLHKDLNKRESALLIQMRTEKIGLRDFLSSRRVPGHQDATCECRQGPQTVIHVLLRCKTLREARSQQFEGQPGRNNLRAILSKHSLATKAIYLMELALRAEGERRGVIDDAER
jgi:ribonuclease HI/exonuclease III